MTDSWCTFNKYGMKNNDAEPLFHACVSVLIYTHMHTHLQHTHTTTTTTLSQLVHDKVEEKLRIFYLLKACALLVSHIAYSSLHQDQLFTIN